MNNQKPQVNTNDNLKVSSVVNDENINPTKESDRTKKLLENKNLENKNLKDEEKVLEDFTFRSI